MTQKTTPTFYFIGVTTSKSSSMKLFPKWVAALGQPEVIIEGLDFVPHDEPDRYRQAVLQIKHDPLSLGGLVTTHKIDLLDATRDLFDKLSPDAQICSEVSSIYKRDGKLCGRATDPIAGGISLDTIIDKNYFGRTGAEVLCFGAGGSATALALHLMRKEAVGDRPRRFVIVNRSPARLEKLRKMVSGFETDIHFEFILNEDPEQNDALMAATSPNTIVINATGMGKDRPGSPITEHGLFPEKGIAWELNYRGELDFMHQALAQQESRAITVEDGWVYFLHGWTQVIADVLHVEIGASKFAQLAQIANEFR